MMNMIRFKNVIRDGLKIVKTGISLKLLAKTLTSNISLEFEETFFVL